MVHRQHCILHAFEQFGALYAQPRWQIPGPTRIRTGYLQLQTPVGAGMSLMEVKPKEMLL